MVWLPKVASLMSIHTKYTLFPDHSLFLNRPGGHESFIDVVTGVGFCQNGQYSNDYISRSTVQGGR